MRLHEPPPQRGFHPKLLIPAVALAAACLFPRPAAAWSRYCGWPTSGITTIPTLVHCDSFSALGHTCDDMVFAVTQMGKPWSTQGGTSVRLGTPTVTSSPSRVPGAILYRMVGEAGDPNIAGVASGNYNGFGTTCGMGEVRLFANWLHEAQRPVSFGATDMIGVGMHETGHALGFGHQADVGVCGSNGDGASRSLMNPGVAISATRTLWLDDFTGLRSGTCQPYPPTAATGVVRIRQTTNQGGAWTPTVDWGSGTNLTPAIAWGNPTGGAGFTLQAATDVNNNVMAWKWSGAWSSGISLGTAMAGPAMAYGNGVFLVAFPRMVSGNEAVIRVMRSIDGSSYTTYDQPTLLTTNRVALAYNAARGQFYMAYSQVPGAGNDWSSAGQMAVVHSSNGVSWSAPWTSPVDYAAAGPGLVCPPAPAPGTKCFLLYPNARYTIGTLREVVFDTTATGDVSGVTSNFSYPRWNTRVVGSRFDVSSAYSPSATDLVFGYRNWYGGGGATVVWREQGDSAPPPGFDDMETGAGFNAGGEVLSTLSSGVGLTVNTAVSPNVVYAIAQAP